MGCKLDKWSVYKFIDPAKGSSLMRPIEYLGRGLWLFQSMPASQGKVVAAENEVYYYRDLADYN